MRIGELARKTGLSADAIRFYETRKLLPPTRRSAAGYRQFGDDDLRRRKATLNKYPPPSPHSRRADQVASAKADWLSVETTAR